MAKQKVCLVTGAAGTLGQHLLTVLTAAGRKVLALGEVADTFSPDVLEKSRIRINTALPVTAASFKKHDVQFCFGDISDISFLASVFSAADRGDFEIELVFHLSGSELIQKNSPAAYHPAYGDTVNVLEVARAYWQSHREAFKGFFYAADTGKKAALQIEKLIRKITEKDGFPAVVYRADPLSNIGVGYTGKTSLSSLYRWFSPVKTPDISVSKEKDTEERYICALKHATQKVLEEVDEGRPLSLD